MATFVLVPGAWLGGWAWDAVTDRLRAAGHTVYPVTLTGLGERKHLARPEVGLETHITDIINLIEANELDEVYLVGHSYAGAPVTGVADRIPGRLASVIYVDSGPIPGGSAYIDLEPEARPFLTEKAAELGGWLLPPLTWPELAEAMQADLSTIPDDILAETEGRKTPQPFATYTEPLVLSNPARQELPTVGILHSYTEEQLRGLIDSGHPMGQMMTGPEWRFIELPTSHWSMWSAPDELSAILDDIAAGKQ